MFGIENPIIQDEMHFVGFAERAVAISKTRGLEIITGLAQNTPASVDSVTAHCKDMTDKPFGENVTLLPTLTPPDFLAIVKALVNGGVESQGDCGTVKNNDEKKLDEKLDRFIDAKRKSTVFEVLYRQTNDKPGTTDLRCYLFKISTGSCETGGKFRTREISRKRLTIC